MSEKPRAKQPKKAKRGSASSRQLQRDIEAAVAKIPSFIAVTRPEVHLGRAKRTSESHSTGQKKALLWSGVTIITAIVFTMWFWNVRLTIFSTNFRHSSEGKILSSAKSELERIFATADARLAVQKLEEKAAIAVTSAAATSSLEASIQAVIAANGTASTSTDDASSTDTSSSSASATSSASSTPAATFPLYATPLRTMTTST